VKQHEMFSAASQPEPDAKPEPEVEVDRATPEPSVPSAPVPVLELAEQADATEDAAARRAAVTEFGKPLLLEAGAGTGKTATLVARVAHWCLGPGWSAESGGAPLGSAEAIAARVLRGVAAITFTEAAAAEMSTRVGLALSAVQRAASGAELDAALLPPGFLPERLPTDVAELRTRAGALRASLDHLNVSTIHAFCRRLLAAHPLEAGMDPDFEVDATFQHVELAVRTAMEQELHDAWEGGAEDDWVQLALCGKTPPDVEAVVVALVTDEGARACDFADDPFGAEACGAAVAALRAAFEQLREPARALDELKKDGRLNARFTLEALDATEAALADVRDEPRAEFTELARRAREIWFERDEQKGWRKLRDWYRKPLAKKEQAGVADAASFAAAARELRGALRPFLEIDVELLELARRVVHRVLGRVEAELRRRGVATFSDLLTCTRDLLVGNPAIAARERHRMRQLLVDEFQDTDGIQCEIVAALALADGDGPGLFLVGDPKQSIFAWRSADLYAYDTFKERVEEAGGRALELTANFRSHAAILAEVERVVAPVMEEVRGVQPPFAALQAARAGADAPREAPSVEHWISWPRDPETDEVEVGETGKRRLSYESEARALARDIHERHAEHGVPWREFAVILRSMSGIDVYLSQLREAGVPYEVQSDRNYYERREIVDATSLVRALLDPADHVALVGFLRSPLVGVPDAALFPLWEAGFPGEMTWLSRPDEERLARVEATLERAFARVPDVPGLDAIEGWERALVGAVRALAELRASFHADPLDRWIERVRTTLFPDATEAARYLGEYRLANLERFFRDLARALEENRGDVRVVLRTLRANVGRTDRTEAARPGDSGRAAVQVLTIHGAKGLEFPHVYLAQTHRNPPPEGGGDVGFEARAGRVAYKLFGSPSLAWLAGAERRAEVEAAERVRLLYVTLTRARERLVVLGTWSEAGRERTWRDAKNANELCRARPAAVEAVAIVAERVRAGDLEPLIDPFGVAWRLAEVHPAPERRASGGEAAEPRAVDDIVDEAAGLAVDRVRAERECARPYHTSASAEAHLEHTEAAAHTRFAGGPGDGCGADGAGRLGRDAAQAAGTAVHRLLEEVALTGDVAGDWTKRVQGLDGLVAELAPAGQADVVLERARELAERIAKGELLTRLSSLGEGVLARELPVLLPPGESGAVGFVSGAIDLLYRDPESDELVVADYKTDRVETEDELQARAEGYRGQGKVYVEAVQRALGLERPPRFELWFLHAGRIEVPKASAPTELDLLH
jgi:ATP-dependent helicase/nuclease subunit A